MNPNLPVGGSAFDQGGVAIAALPQDITQLALTLRFSSFATVLEGVQPRANVEGQAVRSALVSLTARHHFGDGFSGELTVPAGTLQYDPGVNRHEQYISGFGDVQLAGRYDLAALWGAGGFRPSLVVEAGLGLPTGSQARAGEGPVPPNILSLGRASFSGTARVLLTQYVHKNLAVAAWLGTAVPLTPTNLGITQGLSVDAGLGPVFQAADFLWLSGRLSAQHLEPSVEQDAGTILSSGGQWLAVEISTALRLQERATLVFAARAPVLAHVNGRQISETVSLSTALAFTFGGDDEDEHDHGGDEHDHGGDEHDHGGGEHDHGADEHAHPAPQEAPAPAGDVVDLARGGESFDLEAAKVPGKVTVVDFWAVWCEPCHEVDRVLGELAATHPELAVRRVEVPTFDTPVAKEHLATAPGLPVLWVFDREGQRVGALDGVAVSELRDALLRVLEEPAAP